MSTTKRITELPQIGYYAIKEDDCVPIDSELRGSRKVSLLSISYKIPISMLGIKADGVTDETEKLRSILNTRDNITYDFPYKGTIITSEPIDVVANGITIQGNECMIKQKDNSGALLRMSKREFCNHHQTGWLSFFGNSNHIEGLIIDINWHNNLYTDANGTWGYFPPRGTKHPSLNSAGFDGITIVGDNNIVTRCKIYNPTWNGISLPNYDYNRNSNPPTLFHENNIISYNEIYNSSQDSICFMGQDNCKVLYNTIEMNRYHGVHAYLKCKNSTISHNNFFCDDNVDDTSIFPDEDLSYSEGCIMLGHTHYPAYNVENMDVEYNTIINTHSTKVINQGITVQPVTHSKDIRIRHNFIRDIRSIGVMTDVYNYGDIIIEDNTIMGVNKGIVIRLGLENDEWNLLPTFTSELPNSNIFIFNNRFANNVSSNFSYTGDAYTVKEKHEAHISECNIYIDDNINVGDGVVKNTSANKDSFDKAIFTKVFTFTKDVLPVKSSLTFCGGIGSPVSGEESGNYFITNGKIVEVNAIFNFKSYIKATDAFYIKTPLSKRLTIPAVYYLASDTSKALKPGLITVQDNKAKFCTGGGGTEEACVVMCGFTYNML